ncbi:MAG: ribonuclease D [Candidatus Nealsonbacteria bacterium]|nr:ribonuclease D [Candidatus Nealsonbacteria bacterium]
MQYENITTDRQLQDYCREIAGSESIALDTEFVSEHTYRPVLCLVQVAAGGKMAVIDTLAVEDVTPFWETLVTGDHETIVHAGRIEMEFCLQAVGQQPQRVFDVQIAAGLAGMEYPAAYGTLVSRLLGGASTNRETRTDWRRRPLSKRQIQYALEDVDYLGPLRSKLHASLQKQDRLEWFDEEIETWQAEIQRSFSHERWRRVSGNSNLNARTLAIVRELWRWREAEAQRRDTPVRRVLRDDLIIELARRGTADVKRIGAVRGLDRGDLRRRLDDIAACIQQGLDLSDEECPKTTPSQRKPKLSVLGQFLFAALSSICRRAQLAPNLVGSPTDVRDWIICRGGSQPSRQNPPKLARGWRAQFVGRLFDDLLDGKTAVRIDDPASECPLVFEADDDPAE